MELVDAIYFIWAFSSLNFVFIFDFRCVVYWFWFEFSKEIEARQQIRVSDSPIPWPCLSHASSILSTAVLQLQVPLSFLQIEPCKLSLFSWFNLISSIRWIEAAALNKYFSSFGIVVANFLKCDFGWVNCWLELRCLLVAWLILCLFSSARRGKWLHDVVELYKRDK